MPIEVTLYEGSDGDLIVRYWRYNSDGTITMRPEHGNWTIHEFRRGFQFSPRKGTEEQSFRAFLLRVCPGSRITK